VVREFGGAEVHILMRLVGEVPGSFPIGKSLDTTMTLNCNYHTASCLYRSILVLKL
jgi:hypothetical protein